jgi:hypothetical protein
MFYRRHFAPVVLVLLMFLAPRVSHAGYWESFWECEGTYHTSYQGCGTAWGSCIVNSNQTYSQCTSALEVCRFNSQETWGTCIGALGFDLTLSPAKCADEQERFASCMSFMHACPDQTGLSTEDQEWCNYGENACYNFVDPECQ